jgi:hypothetical protein
MKWQFFGLRDTFQSQHDLSLAKSSLRIIVLALSEKLAEYGFFPAPSLKIDILKLANYYTEVRRQKH